MRTAQRDGASSAEASDSLDRQAEMRALEAIQRRILWISTAMVHHANRIRPNSSGVKVGGHQASSASIVTVMTALWFQHLRSPDRVSVKPHASPVLHAINYLLGELDVSYLERLREYGGLQSYPSRTKDPDPVDYSTGSVGIGATQTIWGALAHRYLAGHFEVPVGGRQIALLGDAELDEGAVWEAVGDPLVAGLGEVLWVVDLNRQSLDRVVPANTVDRLIAMFKAAGWHTSVVKYGPHLHELFNRSGGSELRERIDSMSNEEYQRLLRCDPPELRDRLPGDSGDRRALKQLVGDLEDGELQRAIRDLGGHDLGSVIESLQECDSITGQPSVIFAYTLKGWRLPIEGHPANHSALLTDGELREVADALGGDIDSPWAPLPPGSPERELCERTAERLSSEPVTKTSLPELPVDLGRSHAGAGSTQQALGRFLSDLSRAAPEAARHVVTVSPDVASSTNLGGWINRAGVWNLGDRIDWFADDSNTLVRWRESDHGQHIELGIAEVNLVGLLAELGTSYSRDGVPLLPIGTIYDPFVLRCYEPWSFGMYAGGQSILIGTPSGVTLGPEGGAHQSTVTPSAVIAQPGCTYWEPAFASDLEWCLLHALSQLGRPGGESAYFRLSTRPLDQGLAPTPSDPAERELLRADVLAGGYVLRDAERDARVLICAVGAMVQEAVEAAETLEEGGVGARVVCLSSPDLIYQAIRAERGFGDMDSSILERVFPAAEPLPIVGVIDGHPQALAFLEDIHRTGSTCLGVTEFGQSGDIADLYRHHRIDAESIIGAALDLI